MSYKLFPGQSVLVAVYFSRKFLRIPKIYIDTWISIREQIPWQFIWLSHYLRMLQHVRFTECRYCRNNVTTFHEVLMGLCSNEGNYFGYFLVDVFHKVSLCFSHYFVCGDGFRSGSLPIFRITGHLASFPIYNKSFFRQRTKFHHFFYHINMPVNECIVELLFLRI